MKYLLQLYILCSADHAIEPEQRSLSDDKLCKNREEVEIQASGRDTLNCLPLEAPQILEKLPGDTSICDTMTPNL